MSGIYSCSARAPVAGAATAAAASESCRRRRREPRVQGLLAAQLAPAATRAAARPAASEAGHVKAGHGEAAGPLLHSAPDVGNDGAGLDVPAHEEVPRTQCV